MSTVEVKELDVREKPDFELPSLEDVRRFFPFEGMREHQDSVVQAVIGAYKAGYKHVVLEAPTGFGKSAVAIALAKWIESREQKSYIIVSSKYLQDQYLSDFDVVTVKGRSNFRCTKNKGHTCETSQKLNRFSRCRHIPYPSKSIDGKFLVGTSAKRGSLYLKKGMKVCPYWWQKCEAMNHAYPLLNYDYFLSETQHVGDFGKRRLIICDEAHNIESKLMRFIGFEVGKNDLESVGVMEIPEKDAKMKTWFNAVGDWRDAFQNKVEEMEDKIDTLTNLDMEKLEGLRERAEKCNFLMGELDENPDLWVISTKIQFFKGRPFRRIMFKPIEIKKWGSHIFSRGDSFLLQSATIINPKTLCESLGIEGKILYVKTPSTFPEKSRLFHYRGVGKMSFANKEKTIPLLVKEVEKIINENPDEKGVVHTHTYEIMQNIVSSVKNPRIIYNETGYSRDDVFQAFRRSDEPLVLVTPSAFEGVDFKGDRCRWQVLCKVPFPHLGDPQIKKRMQLDEDWYTWLTALRIVQTYGRGMRSHDDFCKTYMLDSSFQGFYLRNKAFFPEWFQDIVRWRSE